MTTSELPLSGQTQRPVFLVGIALLMSLVHTSDAVGVRPIDVIGHRGNSGEAPENTLVAIDQAFDLNAAIVEVDIRSSAEGTAWLMHDVTVNRTTDGFGSINGLTDEQVRTFDAGAWFSAQYAGEPVPTLAEAMAAADGRGALFLDLKETGLEVAIANALTDSGFIESDLWLWVGTNTGYAASLHAAFPEAKILWGGDESRYQSDGTYFDDLANLGVWGFDVAYGSLTPGFVAAARAEGFYVSTYTVNKVSDMERAISFGIDGMETDFPRRLYALFDFPLDIDLNADGVVDSMDWGRLLQNQRADLTSLSGEERRRRGDLNSDGRNDHADFVLFKTVYTEQFGAVAFAELTRGIETPEPTSLWLVVIAALSTRSSPKPIHSPLRRRLVGGGGSSEAHVVNERDVLLSNAMAAGLSRTCRYMAKILQATPNG